MASIIALTSHIDVKAETQTVPVICQLSVISPGDVVLLTGSTSGVSLYTESGAVYYELVSIGKYRYYLNIPPGAKSIVAVLGTAAASCKVTVTSELVVATPITTQEYLPFSDDFTGTAISREKWSLAGTVSYLTTDGSSNLALALPASANKAASIKSDWILGKANVKFKDFKEVSRASGACCEIGVVLTDSRNASATITDKIAIGFNTSLRSIVPLSDANTVVRFNVMSGSIWGTESSVTLPSGNTSTVHEYDISFDGHTVTFVIDGTTEVTRTVNIPESSFDQFYVYVSGVTDGTGPSGIVTYSVDRISAVPESTLSTTATIGGTITVGLPSGAATEATLGNIKTDVDKIPASSLITRWHPGMTSTGAAAAMADKRVLSDDSNPELLGYVLADQAARVWCKVSGNPPDASCFAHYLLVSSGSAAPTASGVFMAESIQDGEKIYICSPSNAAVYVLRESGKAGITIGLIRGQVP
jgi:hypothetical protein